MSGFAHLGDKLERDTIVAPAFSRRLWTVVEDMAMMAAAARAMILGARQNKFVICAGFERCRDRREKARPAGAAFVFHVRGKDRQAAAGAGKNSRALLAIERARTGRLGALLAQNVELIWLQTFAPLL